MNPKTNGQRALIQPCASGVRRMVQRVRVFRSHGGRRQRDTSPLGAERPYLAGTREPFGSNARPPKTLGRNLPTRLCLVALLLMPGLSHAIDLASASSTISMVCGGFTSSFTNPGAFSDSCTLPADAHLSRAEANALTSLSDRPLAAATAANVVEAGKYKMQAQGSAHLTYEVRLAESAAPPVALARVPVTVWVRGEVVRETQLTNAITTPEAIASAAVYIRSNPALTVLNADVLSERALRNPGNAFFDTPNFDKRVAVSLIPGHTYLVDLVAGCLLQGGSVDPSRISFRSSCSAEADPVFELDQAALDKRLGASSFSLASYYGFEYSAGVSPVPEPGTIGMMLAGLAGLCVGTRRRLGGTRAPG